MIPGMDVLNFFDPQVLSESDFDKIFQLAGDHLRYARQNGLLALYESSEDETLPPIFQKGLKMVMDDVDPIELKAQLSDLILGNKEDSLKATRGVLYMQSILSIQLGESEAVLKMRLTALNGIESLSNTIEELSQKL